MNKPGTKENPIHFAPLQEKPAPRKVKRKVVIQEYNPKSKADYQVFTVYRACEMVDLLMSILVHCKGATVHAGRLHFDDCLGVVNTRGRTIAYILTKWDGKE